MYKIQFNLLNHFIILFFEYYNTDQPVIE